MAASSHQGRHRPLERRPPRRTSPTGLSAAVLCLGVVWIHVQDQGGFPGSKSPGYVALGYFALEAVGVLSAVLLVAGPGTRLYRAAWLLAMGVSAGPLLGFALSRGPGLPGYGDDKGNWTEPLGLLSLLVESVLLVLSLVALVSARSTRTTTFPATRHEPVGATAD
ncbi:hypothetical protein ABIA33_002621 [Streptacidiphilus sp. MAP12-16]|uniref:hypothetical protein n=1 Tax=Streptacidiphilus sp. MAP12-16 TaxID=3156300 RepID=UPI00351716F8